MSETEYKHYDLMIFGAGIAGLSAAYAASNKGLKTVVIDRKKPGYGASGTPMALLNPATGRKAKKTWEAEKCLVYTKNLLAEVSSFSGQPCYSENGVMRPALDGKIAEGMMDSFNAAEWPPGWIEWLDEREIRNRFPGINCTTGGLWIPAGGTVAMKEFTQSLYLLLQSKGVDFYLGSKLKLVHTNPFHASDDTIRVTSNIMLQATGMGLTEHPLWQMLPLHRVKGQTLTIQLKTRLDYECSISSLGYIAQMPERSGEIVLGSTYEHHFDHLEADEKGAEYLVGRLSRTIPELRNRINKRVGWSGVRVTVPDKKPVIGSHPDVENLYTICALGSKGLMHGPYLGNLLIDHILNRSDIPEIFNIERVLGFEQKG